MAEREIKVVISAQDDYTAAVNKFKAAMGETSAAVNEASKASMSWTEFLKGRMGPAMKEFGNHTDAVRALSAEYKQYKATGVDAYAATAAASSNMGSSATKTFGEIQSAWLKMAAVIASTAWLQSAAKDVLEAESTLNKLRIQLEGIGKSYNTTVSNAVTAAANYARVQDGEVNKTLQELILISGDAEKSVSNLNITYDLAYQKGISVSEAAALVGRAMTGNIDMLSRYMLEFKNLNEKLGENATEAEKAAYAMAVLEEKTNGALAQMTEHEKKVRDLTNAYKDLKQGIGGVVVEFGSWVLLEATFSGPRKNLEELSRAVGNLVDSLRYGTKAVQEMDAAIDTQIKLDAFYEHAITLVGNAHKKTAEEVRSGIKALSDSRAVAKEAMEAFDALFSTLNENSGVEVQIRYSIITAMDFLNMDDLKAHFEMQGGIFGAALATGTRDSFEKMMASAIGDVTFDELIAEHEKYINTVQDMMVRQYEQEQQLAQMRINTVTSMASNMTDTMQALFVATGSNNEAMFNAYKIFAVSEALISTYLAINKTLAEGGWWAIPLAVSVGIMGFANAAAIASQEMTGSASSTTTTSTGETITTGSTDTSSSLVAESSSSGATQNITINIQNGSGSGDYWQDVVENNIIPAINDASDRNVEITINRA